MSHDFNIVDCCLNTPVFIPVLITNVGGPIGVKQELENERSYVCIVAYCQTGACPRIMVIEHTSNARKPDGGLHIEPYPTPIAPKKVEAHSVPIGAHYQGSGNLLAAQKITSQAAGKPVLCYALPLFVAPLLSP